MAVTFRLFCKVTNIFVTKKKPATTIKPPKKKRRNHKRKGKPKEQKGGIGKVGSALPGWLAKVHYSPWSVAACNKCSRKPQPRVVQLNTGNNGHHSTSSARRAGTRAMARRHTGNDRMQEAFAQHLGLARSSQQLANKFRGGKEFSNNRPARQKPGNAIITLH